MQIWNVSNEHCWRYRADKILYTDRQMGKVKPVYISFNFVEAGGIIKGIDSPWLDKHEKVFVCYPGINQTLKQVWNVCDTILSRRTETHCLHVLDKNATFLMLDDLHYTRPPVERFKSLSGAEQANNKVLWLIHENTHVFQKDVIESCAI